MNSWKETKFRQEHSDELMETRQKVLKAFSALRNRGFLARANFMCCSTCAGYDLAVTAVKIKKDGKDVKGCVFWHHQDDEGYWANGNLFLGYGPLETREYGTIGLTTEEVGKIVCEELKRAGVEPTWNGNTNERIVVTIPSIRNEEDEAERERQFMG